jgi:hypothetical protein
MTERPVPELKGRAVLERLYGTPYEAEAWISAKCVCRKQRFNQ